MVQMPGGEARGHGRRLPVPQPAPQPRCIPASLSQQRRKAASQGLLAWWRKFALTYCLCHQILGVGAGEPWGWVTQQCRRGSTKASWGCGGLAPPSPQRCFWLTAGFKPPSWHLSGKEVRRSLGFIFLHLEHSWGKQVLSGLPTPFLSVKCSFAKLIISVGWESLKGTFLSSI